MKKNHSFLRGTLTLTFTGLVCRLIGFFYRTFLSKAFGAEGMGIYQLIAPIMAITYSLTSVGIQTAVSKYTASETTTHDYHHSFRVLSAGAILAVPLSLVSCFLIYHKSDWIACYFLHEARTAPLLRIYALSIPFCSLHTLANGYLYGIKCASIPAIAQILEQLTRVGSVFFLYHFLTIHNQQPTITCAAVGLGLEECVSSIFTYFILYFRFRRLLPHSNSLSAKCVSSLVLDLAKLAAPLSANRISINLLQSLEAVSIPACLIKHGMNHSQALSIYGVLTGMALPLILFPTALVSSACLLLLPIISEAQENRQQNRIRDTTRQSIFLSALFGVLCTMGFLLFGKQAGKILFHNELAASFILTLSFICPLLYISNALSSILHGLGKTGIPFLLNILALGIRLAFVFLFIPMIGIQGYLYGLLLSQLISTLLLILTIRFYT